MKAVWSFWSQPLREKRSFWKSELHHLFSWVISVENARRHYPRTALYTDDDGARLLVDTLGLEFEHVSTRLNDLAGHNPAWWALGKVLTYSLQEEPFVHIDSDVYLWSALPERLTMADVLAQNPEVFHITDPAYREDLLQQAIRAANGWIPVEMASYTPRIGVPKAACCGIVGGRRVDFIRHYAGQALRMLEQARNLPESPIVWERLKTIDSLNVVFEQHLLVACLDYHRARAESQYAGIQIEYLFNSFHDANQRASQAGFTHLMGEAKQNAEILARLEKRVRTQYPATYERCIDYCGLRKEVRSLEPSAAGGRW